MELEQQIKHYKDQIAQVNMDIEEYTNRLATTQSRTEQCAKEIEQKKQVLADMRAYHDKVLTESDTTSHDELFKKARIIK